MLAVKFVETLVLLYTPDPYISSDPPQESDFGKSFFFRHRNGSYLGFQPSYIQSDAHFYFIYIITDVGFNISWLRVGHALLNVGELAVEASQSLGLLLDQLRFPQVKTLSNSMVIVLIKRLFHLT